MRSFKIELKPNKTQSVLFVKSAGTARFAFNRKLGELSESYKRAKNLQYFAAWMLDLVGSAPSNQPTESSSESYACGDERLQFLQEQCSSVKQEFKSANLDLPTFA